MTLRPNKTSFTPRYTIIGKGIAYVKPLDQTLPLRPIEIELENNHCCMEVITLQILQWNFYMAKKWHILMPGIRA